MTTKSTHTKGPWTAFGRTVYAANTMVSLALSDYDAERAPAYQASDNLLSDDEALANAQLIASAPELLRQRDELLAALQSIANAEYGTDKETFRDIARDAIAVAHLTAGAKPWLLEYEPFRQSLKPEIEWDHPSYAKL